MFSKFTLFLVAAALVANHAFAPVAVRKKSVLYRATANPGEEVDSTGNNVAVKELLLQVEDSKLLSKVASSGLLSKAQAAGVSLTALEPLLLLAADNPAILVLVEAAGPELLPLLPTLVQLAPPALPLLAAAIAVPPALIGGAGIASLGAAAAAVLLIPDNTVIQVAEQTLIVGILGLAVPAISLAAAAALGTVTKK